MTPPDTILDALNWRYATKKFDTHKKLEAKQVENLLEAARLAPSSFGLAPWKFVVVKDTELRGRIREAAWNQLQVTEASHLIVFCAKDDITEADIDAFIGLNAETKGVPIDSLQGFHDMLTGFRAGKSTDEIRTWAERQTYIPLGMLLLAAAERRIDACPMEGFDPKKVDAILGLEELGVHSVAMVALGHRATHDIAAENHKVRASQDDVIVEK